MNIFRGKSKNLVFFGHKKTIRELKFLSKLGVVFKASNKAKITRKISVMSFETTDPSVWKSTQTLVRNWRNSVQFISTKQLRLLVLVSMSKATNSN